LGYSIGRHTRQLANSRFQRLCDFYFLFFFVVIFFSITGGLKIIIRRERSATRTWKAGEEAEAGEVLFFPGHHLVVMMMIYAIFTLTRIRQLQ